MRNKSNKFRVALTIVSSILCAVLLGGVIASVVTKTTPFDWFKEDDAIVDVPVVDEPVVEEVLPLVATTEEEMNALLTEENVGRTVTYAGETIKNVRLPFEKGDFIDRVCFDTFLNLDDFILSFDWDNPHFEESMSDFTVSYMFFWACGNCSLQEFISCVNGELVFDDDINGDCPMYFGKVTLNSTNEIVYYCLYFLGAAQYVLLNPTFDYDQVDVVPSAGWQNDADVVFSFENTLSDIHPMYASGDCLFIGVPDDENIDFGSVEIIYENNVEYVVVANESDEGFHFEVA